MNPILSFCESEPIRLTQNLHSIILAILNTDLPYTASISRDSKIANNTVQSAVNQLDAKNYIKFLDWNNKKIIYFTEAGYNLAKFCEAL